VNASHQSKKHQVIYGGRRYSGTSVCYLQADLRKEAPIKSSQVNPTLRILVVDDHGIVREGLSVLLERDGTRKVVGSVATGEEAVIAAERLSPDIVIMDLVLPSLNGIDATRNIVKNCPRISVIALSACHTPEQVSRALNAGARGYVVKAAVGNELIRAISEVMAGRRYISPAISDLLTGGGSASTIPLSPYDCLSDREREVLHCVVGGLTSSDIARRLSLSRKTVDTYRGRMMVKLGVANRSALIRYALKYELPSV